MEGSIGKVLIVDDDENICEVIKMYVENSGYSTRVCNNGREAEEVFLEYKPDLVLLDIMLPNIDGIDVLKWIRKDYETPVIMLTAKGETFDKVLGLELGADDYIVKPFETIELLARIEAVLRRYNSLDEILKFKHIEFHVEQRIVQHEGKAIDLTLKEFDLLMLFLKNKNIALSRNQILERVWGYDYEGETRTVDIHVQRLRDKLGLKECIKTIFKVGYRLED